MMTAAVVKRIFIYEPRGMLRRVDERARKPYPWRPTGRYLAFTHSDGSAIYLHQAIWLYHHGYVPKMLDHINGDTCDNRIENLRVCTPSQNQFNSKRKLNNKSGFKGVVFHPKCTGKPWHAKINLNGRRISLGYHKTKEEAAAAYAAGATKYAGEFARKD